MIRAERVIFFLNGWNSWAEEEIKRNKADTSYFSKMLHVARVAFSFVKRAVKKLWHPVTNIFLNLKAKKKRSYIRQFT